MKRFHVHIGVTDLEKSIAFYTALFGQAPAKRKEDYAKWMLEDPRLNFAISTRALETGLDHFGIQVDQEEELVAFKEQLRQADLGLFGEGETTCCYAKSEKAWVRDPSGFPWEAYRTMEDAEVYSEKPRIRLGEKACCAPTPSPAKKSCC